MSIMKGKRLTRIRRDPGPHGCAMSGEMCVSLSPRRAARSSRDKWYQSESSNNSEKDVEELIDSDGGFCVRDSYLEEIGDGEF